MADGRLHGRPADKLPHVCQTGWLISREKKVWLKKAAAFFALAIHFIHSSEKLFRITL
jgi:hypothetical protein